MKTKTSNKSSEEVKAIFCVNITKGAKRTLGGITIIVTNLTKLPGIKHVWMCTGKPDFFALAECGSGYETALLGREIVGMNGVLSVKGHIIIKNPQLKLYETEIIGEFFKRIRGEAKKIEPILGGHYHRQLLTLQ